jgi:FAD/FMN-containing dehydrogenase
MTTMKSEVVAGFRAVLRGPVLEPGDADYDAARMVWNAMIERRPALIARCSGTADVLAALAFAKLHRLPVAVRGGGHNIAGNAVCDDGLVIDLSGMRSVHVDPEARLAWADGGALLADVDHETQAFGLAVPLGINSTTGVGGLTLGGGFGWLSRMHGLTVDNLVGAEIVTADGMRRYIGPRQEAELFWAIRGGGGNFGVVTRFEFALHEVGPEVTAGLSCSPTPKDARCCAATATWSPRCPTMYRSGPCCARRRRYPSCRRQCMAATSWRWPCSRRCRRAKSCP